MQISVINIPALSTITPSHGPADHVLRAGTPPAIHKGITTATIPGCRTVKNALRHHNDGDVLMGDVSFVHGVSLIHEVSLISTKSLFKYFKRYTFGFNKEEPNDEKLNYHHHATDQKWNGQAC